MTAHHEPIANLYRDVLNVRDSAAFNETERRNELLALDILFRAGYYCTEP